MRILYLELKRVLKSRLTWILLALALLLSVLSAWLPTTYCYSNYTDEAGNEVNLTGLASIAHEKERQADAAGMVPAIMEIDPEQIDDYYSVCESRIVSLMQME